MFILNIFQDIKAWFAENLSIVDMETLDWVVISQVSTTIMVVFGFASIYYSIRLTKWSKRVETTNYFHNRFDDYINNIKSNMNFSEEKHFWRQYWQLQEEQYLFYNRGLIDKNIYKGWMTYRDNEWRNNHAFGVDGFRDAFFFNRNIFIPSFRKYIERRYKVKKAERNIVKPIGVCWKITSACNYSCEFCFAKKEHSNIELATQIEILLNLKKEGVRYLSFTGGEPTLCKNIVTLLRLAKDFGFYVDLCTNGKNYSKDFHSKIIDSIDQISIPLDGINNESIKDIRGIDSGFDVFMEAASLLKGTHVKVRANTLLCKRNIGQLKQIQNIVESYGFDWKILKYYHIGSEVDKFSISEGEFRSYTENLISSKIEIKLKVNSLDYQKSFISLDSNGIAYLTVNHKHHELGSVVSNSLSNMLFFADDFYYEGHKEKYRKFIETPAHERTIYTN